MQFVVRQILVFNFSFVYLPSDVGMLFKLPKLSLLIIKMKIIIISTF